MPKWGFDSEYGALQDVLLCRPDHYRWEAVNAVAKATLEADTPLNLQKAQHQYNAMVEMLEGAGVTTHFLDLESHLAFQCFTRDSSQMTPWGAVINQLARIERRGEWSQVLKFYEANDIPVWRHATAGTIEGGDIHVIKPGLLLIGYSGTRTTREGAQQLARWFEAEGWEAKIYGFPEHFLHLDVLFSMVGEGLALACTDALDDDLIGWLSRHSIKLIPVNFRETMQLGCNALALGEGRVVSPKHNRSTNAALRDAGLEVLEPELDCFTRGGGGIHCLTMPLRRESVPG
ncbi:MAG: dimethylarginine dimethylaminohydrolase family protein [Sphingomonadales bacterium]